MPALMLPLALVIASSAIYHLSLKTLSSKGDPFGVIGLAYLLAMGVCLCFRAFGPKAPVAGRLFCADNWPVLFLGLALAGIEIGVFFAYRSGLRVSAAPVLINGAVLLCLLSLDAAVFHNSPSPRVLGGAALILAGMFVMQGR